MREGIKKLHEGLIGDVYMARGLCFKWRNTIGRAPVRTGSRRSALRSLDRPGAPARFHHNRFHYNWHWFWYYGNGDMGNQGTHQVDVARWGLGVGFPNKVSAIGGHFMFDDDQETPNDVSCAFEFDLPDGKRRMITFEVRHWITNHEAEIGTPEMGTPEPKRKPGRPGAGPLAGGHNTIGDIFYGSKGYFATGDEDADTYGVWLGPDQEPQPRVHGGAELAHFKNFIDCVVSRKKENLNAPIEEGYISMALMHLANASYRLGRTLNFNPDTQQVINDPEADTLLRDGDRGYRAPFTRAGGSVAIDDCMICGRGPRFWSAAACCRFPPANVLAEHREARKSAASKLASSKAAASCRTPELQPSSEREEPMSQTHRYAGKAVYAVLALLVGVTTAATQTKTDPLKSGFENPPEGARPRVWWHWMNGNISKEGIKLDLEWMHRVGLGGYQNFDAALSTPQVVPKRLAYMTPEWKDAFKYAVVLGDQLGLEEAIAGSPGWSESGGPWVPASQGMKKYVWSETPVEGGQAFTGTVAHPPSNTGAFQNLSIRDLLERPAGSKPVPEFYADVAVVAYRVPESDVPLESLHPKVTASGGNVDVAVLSDGDLEKTTKLPIPTAAGQSSWIQYEFDEPQTIHAVSIVTKNPGGIAAMLAGIGRPEKTLEASDDGQDFRAVVKLPDDGAPEHTVSFPAVKAKFFRVVFKRTPPPPLPAWASGIDPASLGIRVGKPPTDYEIAELVLHPGARVNRFEDKAAFSSLGDLYEFATPSGRFR